MNNNNPKNINNTDRRQADPEKGKQIIRRAARRPRNNGAVNTKQASNRINEAERPCLPGADSLEAIGTRRAINKNEEIANPKELIRRLEKNSEIKATEHTELIKLNDTISKKAVTAPLPRDIQFKTPEINSELMRRKAAERQKVSAGKSFASANAPHKETVQQHNINAVNAARLQKPLPQRSAGSARDGKMKTGYKRADDFLPEKLSIMADKKPMHESERHVFIEGRNPSDDGSGDISEFDEKPPRRSTALTSLLKAIVYIVFILTVSGFLSYFIISVGNDVFAFVKPSEEITVDIPEYATIDNIADILSQKGLIKYPFIFKIYAMLRKDDGGYVFGEYQVSPSMNYDQLRVALKGTVEERKQISITIPEGFTVDEIIDMFVLQYGMGTREGFVDAVQNGNFNYWFLDELVQKPGRKYRLEGYLYPDTYYFFSDWSEINILKKLLNNFNSKFDKAYEERCRELDITVDELITLASMIEMEGKYTYEFGAISAVFHNRLNNPQATAGKLESDATIQYVLSERHEDLTVDDLALDSPYNTYLYPGLPAGPITNPSLNAIHSAMYPDEVNYYYFVSRPNGQNLFAVTYPEHLINKQLAASEKAA